MYNYAYAHHSQKEEVFLDMIIAVCMAAFNFLRALNFFKPVIVSCLCMVEATFSRFYVREREARKEGGRRGRYKGEREWETGKEGEGDTRGREREMEGREEQVEHIE